MKKSTSINVLFISNGIWEYDGRMRELTKVADALGDAKYITRAGKNITTTHTNHISIIGKSYLFYIIKTIIEGIKTASVDVLFVDNRKAIIPSLFLIFIKKRCKVIYDCRELYLCKEVGHLTGKIGCFFESIMLKKVDVVLCANNERAKLMNKLYQLKGELVVYQNIRKLNSDVISDHKEFERKYSHIFDKKTIKLISTSGFLISRRTDILIKAIAMLGNNCDLLLVGGGTEKDKKEIERLIIDLNVNNVHLVNKVKESELKFLVSRSDIGIVSYGSNDLNNKYCASGKIFEFIFEGLPVVTTENRPLSCFVIKNKIGVSDNLYFNGICEVMKNYNYYKDKVNVLASQISPENNIHEVAKQIVFKLKKS